MCNPGCETGWKSTNCLAPAASNCAGAYDAAASKCDASGCSNGVFFGTECTSPCEATCKDKKCVQASGDCVDCPEGKWGKARLTACKTDCNA